VKSISTRAQAFHLPVDPRLDARRKGFHPVSIMSFKTLIPAALAACLAFPAHAAARNPSSTGYYTTVSAGVPLKVITVDLNDLNVKVTGQLSRGGAGHAETFQQMIRRVQPTIAITGTFFCNRTLIPIGDIVIDGQLAHFGGLGTAMCMTEDNQVEFIRPRQKYTHQDWSRFDFVLACGPRLLNNGVVGVYPAAEGFRDKHMLNRNGRVAVGVTKGNKLVIVATRKPVYLSKLAKAMKGIGVRDALNLDGGSSIGVYYKGKLLIKPSRSLTNLMVVYQDRERYEGFKDQLRPMPAQSASR
jgi:hypothetical protein